MAGTHALPILEGQHQIEHLDLRRVFEGGPSATISATPGAINGLVEFWIDPEFDYIPTLANIRMTPEAALAFAEQVVAAALATPPRPEEED